MGAVCGSRLKKKKTTTEWGEKERLKGRSKTDKKRTEKTEKCKDIFKRKQEKKWEKNRENTSKDRRTRQKKTEEKKKVIKQEKKS